MAGIGFELKKIFNRKGVFAGAYAYGYAAIICCGPMILGMMLLLGIAFIGKLSGAGLHERELLNGMITTTLLAGLMISGFFSLLVTRHVADILYEEQNERVMPSFWGSTAIMLVLGDVLYGIFLCFAGIPTLYCVECLFLFGEVVVVWTEISYLTAVKDYQGIMVAFFLSLAAGLAVGALLVLACGLPVVPALLFAVIFSYGCMLLRYLQLLLAYFPKSRGSCLYFLRWMDKVPTLAWTGLFTNIGLFAHLVLMWAGPQGQQIEGLFYQDPDYDLGAIFAFLSLLITTVNFVVSVEVNFYPAYRNYYALFNDKGTLPDIEQAGKELLETLDRELNFASLRQLCCSLLSIILGSVVFKKLAIGITDVGLGIFRILCIGYGLYAIANMLMLILLYFSDNTGALLCSGVFAAATVAGTLLSIFLVPQRMYGVGFSAGAFLFAVCAWLRLEWYTERLDYHLLCSQPIVAQEHRGFWTRISERAERGGKEFNAK